VAVSPRKGDLAVKIGICTAIKHGSTPEFLFAAQQQCDADVKGGIRANSLTGPQSRGC
jgi:hypothetical protein